MRARSRSGGSLLCAHTRLLCVVLLIIGVVLFGSPRIAQASDELEPGVASFVGAQPSGLPGIGRVAVASPRPPHVAAALGAGYGVTEGLGTESGSHHRIAGTLGLAVQPLRFFSAALMLDGRYDKHPDDVLGSSSSTVGEPRLVARVADALGKSFALGGQLVLWMPGGEAPSVRPEASTLDATVLGTYAPPGTDLAVALNAGYRVDRSASSVDAAQRPRLRPGDRLSLQASDFDAVLLGLGGSKRLGDVEVLGELTWDVLIGKTAPSATESPLRLGAGARYHVKVMDGALGNMQIELRSELGLGQRPASGPTDSFAPIEPRFALLAGLRWVLPLTKAAPTKTVTLVPGDGTTPLPAVVVGAVRGRVTGETGEPIAGARLTATTPPVGTAQADEHAAETGADGAFVVDNVRAGRARVVAKAPGYEETSVEVAVDPRAPVVANLAMKRAIRPGQLRGLVRSFNGKPLAATIRVEPLNVETKTDADGTFQIDVPPGGYEVVVASPGYAGQRRPVQVEENGVTILNADLRPGQ